MVNVQCSMNNVSIIVTLEEQQAQLRDLLPRLLSLRYGGEYEVIVVDKMHDKDLKEWLEEMEVHHSNLCHTFCPASARGIDTQRLALTLGAKAANYEWLVIMPVDAKLRDEDWLRKLLAGVTDETDIIIGVNDRKFRWRWLASYFIRRKFSLFRPNASVILCRRSILLQAKDIKLSSKGIVRFNS